MPGVKMTLDVEDFGFVVDIYSLLLNMISDIIGSQHMTCTHSVCTIDLCLLLYQIFFYANDLTAEYTDQKWLSVIIKMPMYLYI
jgi:hypothetical protein